MYTDYIYLYDKKAATVAGGGSVSGAWRTRDLTDEVEDTGNDCTLAANQFTLEAGTYRCLISAPALSFSPRYLERRELIPAPKPAFKEIIIKNTGQEKVNAAIASAPRRPTKAVSTML